MSKLKKKLLIRPAGKVNKRKFNYFVIFVSGWSKKKKFNFTKPTNLHENSFKT
jgi:hypothetical protein